MNMQTIKTLHSPLLVGGIAAILVSGVAIASLAISAQAFNGDVGRAEPPVAVAAPAVAETGGRVRKCAECGVIESTRKIEIPDELIQVHAPVRIAAANRDGNDGKQAANYAITIRLRDGSLRVITDANPARWRAGERVSLIGGME